MSRCGQCILFKTKSCYRAGMELECKADDFSCGKDYIPAQEIAEQAQQALYERGMAAYRYWEYDELGQAQIENMAFAVAEAITRFGYISGNGMGNMSKPAREGMRCGDCSKFRTDFCQRQDDLTCPAAVNWACCAFESKTQEDTNQ